MADVQQAISDIRRSVTAYDVLGYFVPGSVLVFAVSLFEYWSRSASIDPESVSVPINTALRTVLAGVANASSWPAQVVVLLAAAIGCYVVGHLVASISAIAIDRFYVEKGRGYPFRRFLGGQVGHREITASFSRGVFFWVNAYFLFRYLSLPGAIPLNRLLPSPLAYLLSDNALAIERLEWAATLSGIALVILFVSWIVSLCLTISQWDSVLRINKSESGQRLSAGLTFVAYVLSVPERFASVLLAKLTHSRRPLDKETVAQFWSVRERCGAGNDRSDFSSAYWFAAMAVRASGPSMSELADNWLRLYGFSRNLGCALYLAALYCGLWWLNVGSLVEFGTDHQRQMAFSVPVLLAIAAFLALFRYYYLYTDYYSKFLIRAVAFGFADRALPSAKEWLSSSQ
ncbi:hypothetical protein [Gemmatimonas aurantiaca]|uniref:hypothetical protein n=1 Tax=Gemmatimonas aurantiaca TaxID=173480 RepID=UPI00301B9018